jgi:hypothetical protein
MDLFQKPPFIPSFYEELHIGRNLVQSTSFETKRNNLIKLQKC